MSIPKLPIGNFACFAIRTRVSSDLRRPAQLGNGVYATTEMPFQIDDFWKEHIGKIQTDDITNSNLFILAQSDEPDSTTKELLDKVNTCHFALLLQGVGYCQRGMSLFGPNTIEGRHVTRLGRVTDYYEPNKVLSADITRESLNSTAPLCQGLYTIYAQQQGTDYLRLRKGFRTFLDASQKSPIDVHERLHQCVRAIEAVIRPRQGDGTKNFKFRCQFFAGRKPEDAELLEEIYELRCAVEHLNPMSDKLSAYSSGEQDDIKRIRAYQAELLAGFIYRKILTDAKILPTFRDEQTIADLWVRPANELIEFWGDHNTIDLHSAWQGRFHDYL
jgi:hypothetical protein